LFALNYLKAIDLDILSDCLFRKSPDKEKGGPTALLWASA
jgi:hypothetical protein